MYGDSHKKLLKENYIGDIIISYNFIDKPKSQSSKSFEEKLIKTFYNKYKSSVKASQWHYQQRARLAAAP